MCNRVIKYFWKYILGTNWFKTISVNLHYFPIKQAIKLPILVSRRVVIRQLGGGGKSRRPYYNRNVIIWLQGCRVYRCIL